MRRQLLLLLLTFFALQYSNAQVDTEFWFAVPEVTSGHSDQPLKLRFASFDQFAKISVIVPANPTFPTLTLNLNAGTAGVIDLTPYKNLLENTDINTVANKGLLVRATAPVTAYYELGPNNNPELFVLKGKNALGYKFYTPFQNIWSNRSGINAYSSIDIVATKNNTKVKIVPSKNHAGGLAGDTITVTLQRGQTYSVRALGVSAADHLNGTYIEADKPIAVTLKDDSVASGTAYDLIGDQIVPTEVNGTEYVVMRGELSSNQDRVFMMPVENNTKISVAGAAPVTLNAGATLVRQFSSDFMYITSDKPIYVFHISGFGFEMAGALIPPIQCTGSGKISFVRSIAGSNNRFFMNVLIKKGYQNYFKLNGAANPFPLTAFKPVAGDTTGEWLAGHIEMTSQISANQAYILTNDSADFHLGIMNGEPNSGGTRYGYFSDFTYFELGPNRPYCSGDSVLLDAGFGKKNYGWYSMDEFGALTFLANGQKYAVKDSGTYVVTVENKAGCKKADTVNLRPLPIPPAPVISGNSMFTVCQKSPAPALVATGLPGHTLGYYFEELGGAFGPQPIYTTDIAKELKIYAVQTKVGEDCESSPALFTVDIKSTPVLSLNPASSYCKDTVVNLSTYVLSDSAGTKNFVYWLDTLNKIQVPRPDSITTFTKVIVSDSSIHGCQAYISVSALPKPFVRTRASGSVCFGTPILMGGDSLPGYRYEWRARTDSDIGLLSNINSANPKLNVSANTFDTLAYAVLIGTGEFPLTCSVLSPYTEIFIKPSPVEETLSGPAVLCAGAKSIDFVSKYTNAATYRWSISNGSRADSAGVKTFITTADTVKFDFPTVTDTVIIKTVARTVNNCVSDTVTFKVAVSNDTLVTPTPAGPTEFCYFDSQNRSYSTLDVKNSQYIWSWQYGDEPVESDSSTGATFTKSWDQDGLAKLWVRQKADFGAGICYGRSDTLDINIKPSPDTLLSLVSPDSVCSFTPEIKVALPGNPASIYNWSINGTPSGDTDSLITFTDLSTPRTITFSATETLNGCAGTAISKSVIVHPLPIIQPVAFDTAICASSRVIAYGVQSTGPDSRFGWLAEGAESITFNPARDTAFVTWRDSINTKTLLISDTNRHGCTSSLPVYNFRYDPSYVELRNISVTDPQRKLMTLSGILHRGTNSPGDVQVFIGSTHNSAFAILPMSTADLAGRSVFFPFIDSGAVIMYLSYTNLCGQTVTDTNIHKSIFISGSSSEKGNIVNLNWNAYQGWPVATLRTELWRALEDGDYELYKTYFPGDTMHISADGDDAFVHRYRLKSVNAAGLESWSNEKVIVFEHRLDNIPNVFTPNNDGANDYFYIDNLVRYPQSELRVFDRWGREVYHSPNYQNNWTADNVNDGVYFYELKPGGPGGKASVAKGYVQILR